eukprot:scaffold26100_cov31-Attheya_sp.AAC.6
MTISRRMQFGTAKTLINQQAKMLIASIKKVKALYMKRGFRIQTMLMDGQFEPLRAKMADLQINLNTIFPKMNTSQKLNDVFALLSRNVHDVFTTLCLSSGYRLRW